jgi:hypothetical protein
MFLYAKNMNGTIDLTLLKEKRLYVNKPIQRKSNQLSVLKEKQKLSSICCASYISESIDY